VFVSYLSFVVSTHKSENEQSHGKIYGKVSTGFNRVLKGLRYLDL